VAMQNRPWPRFTNVRLFSDHSSGVSTSSLTCCTVGTTSQESIPKVERPKVHRLEGLLADRPSHRFSSGTYSALLWKGSTQSPVLLHSSDTVSKE
jgi:hypothetical protein